MTSVRNRSTVEEARDAYLDAAREALLAVGWSRTTLTDIARRAGVSRMTLYRTWPDMDSLLGDLMTREWAGLIRIPTAAERSDRLRRIADGVVATVAAVRDNPVFLRVVELDPHLLLPYLLDRPGRSQQLVIDVLATEIRAGQAEQAIHGGDPDLLARSLVLAAHGFVLSAHTMGEPAELDAELAALVRRYLAP